MSETRVQLPSRRALRRGVGRAFTLVELLVVLGILSVLISILLPSLSRARQQALTIQCAVNLRTFAQAWHLYAQANGRVSCPGRLPTTGSPKATGTGVYYIAEGEQYRPRWYELLGETVGRYACKNPKNIEDDSWTIENPTFLCPTVPNWTNSRNYAYGYNFQFLGNARLKPDGKWINYPVKADRINATETVMAADCLGTAAGKPKASRTGYYMDGQKDRWGLGDKGWALDPPRLTNDSDYADPERRAPEHRSAPDPRHSGRANFAFCDGRVEALAPTDLGYVMNNDGSWAAMGPHTHNRMFSGTGRDDDPPPAK